MQLNYSKKIIKISALILVSIASIILVSIAFVYFGTKNITSGSLELEGISERIIINRDQYGVPHIEANNDRDALFALGYTHAQDRLWQMELQRHISKGSLSEMFGEDTLSHDKFLRTLGFYRAAQASWHALPANTKLLFQSYIKGVNSFIKKGKLPLQFKIINYQPTPWDDVDSIAWLKMMAWDLQRSWTEKLQNYIIATNYGKDQVPVFLPKYPLNAPIILSDVNNSRANNSEINVNDNIPILNDASEKNHEEIKLGFENVPGKGSNNWVVSGSFTENSKPLLANDPHLALAAPMLWYLADIKTPNFHSIGATIPGLPGIVIGHNEYIAWGVTNGCVDTQDLYIEPENANFKIINEIIKVKGKSDVVHSVRVTSHGPIISDVSNAGKIGKNVSLKWTSLEANDTSMQTFMQLSYVKNWNEFKNALSYFVGPSQNFVYADKKGNIGYYLPGKIPIRKGWTGAYPIDSRDNLEWEGYIPFHKMPQAYNPPKGFIVSANNKIISDNYPYSLTFRCGVAPYRAERIEELIKLKLAKKITPIDMEHIQNDVLSYLWKDLNSELLKTVPSDEISKKALIKLKKWDGKMTITSEEATIYSYWYRELIKLVPQEIREVSEWPDPVFIKMQLKNNGNYCHSSTISDCSSFLTYTLKNAMFNLVQDHTINEKNWQWGKIHKVIFKDVEFGNLKYLNWIWDRKISTGGDPYTINPGSYNTINFNHINGAGYRQIVDLNNFDNSLFIQALGQSNNFFSKNYDNLMPLWRDGKYIPMSSSKEMWGKYETLKLIPN